MFTCALPLGRVLAAGDEAGVLLALGRSFVLVVPAGTGGAIVSVPPERVHAPVGFADVLYELEPLARAGDGRAPATDTRRETKSAATASGPLTLRSPQSGRFYHRSRPGEPAFVAAGQTIADGQPIGLIEVMKTFTHVPYRAGSGLPARARVVRLVAADGADVRQGDPLIEVEPEA